MWYLSIARRHSHASLGILTLSLDLVGQDIGVKLAPFAVLLTFGVIAGWLTCPAVRELVVGFPFCELRGGQLALLCPLRWAERVGGVMIANKHFVHQVPLDFIAGRQMACVTFLR